MCWREESSLNLTDPHPGLRNTLSLGYQVKFIQDEHTTLMSPENPAGDEGGKGRRGFSWLGSTGVTEEPGKRGGTDRPSRDVREAKNGLTRRNCPSFFGTDEGEGNEPKSRLASQAPPDDSPTLPIFPRCPARGLTASLGSVSA